MLRLLGVLGLTLMLLLAACAGGDDDDAGDDPLNDATAPASTTPPADAEVAELLNGFLEARVAGEGAQHYLSDPEQDIPLLYATTSGARYDRAEFAPGPGIEWPHGFRAFEVRLFAGDTVVEQLFFVPNEDPGHFPADDRLGLEYQPDSFGTDIAPTTEDSMPVAVSYDAFDGEVTLQVAHPWVFSYPSIRLIPEGPGERPTTDGGQRTHWDDLVLTADPASGGTCRAGTGPGPIGAQALAESIRSVPGVEATDPVPASAAGAEALMMDVAIAAGAPMTVAIDEDGNICEHEVLRPLFSQTASGSLRVDNITGLETGGATGDRMRL